MGYWGASLVSKGKELRRAVVQNNGSDTPRVNGNRYEELDAVLKQCDGEAHLIVIQGAPDPDAISSAMALRFLSQLHNIETTILCFALPSHHENRALVKRLDIPLVKYSESFDLSQFTAYSIVDSQKYQTPIDKRLIDNDLTFLAFVDHHREDAETPPALFVDTRQFASSTAAIFCEYLGAAMPKGLEPSDPEHVKLATSLMHGMRSDTKKLLHATRLEYEASEFVVSCVDTNIIETIERQVLSSPVMSMLENALVRRRVHDNFIFSDVGFVRSADRDGIPLAAELLLQREGTDTVLVIGIVDEKIIDGSFRTQSERINPDEFLKGFLGVSPESGIYYGGGNVRDRGAFQIPLGFLASHEDRNQVYSMALEVIQKSFLDYIGKTIIEE